MVPSWTSQPLIALNSGVPDPLPNGYPYNIPGGNFTDSKGVIWAPETTAYYTNGGLSFYWGPSSSAIMKNTQTSDAMMLYTCRTSRSVLT